MKINEKKSRRAEQLGQPAGRPKTVREAFARINKKHLVMLIVNCVVFIGLYRLFMNAACALYPVRLKEMLGEAQSQRKPLLGNIFGRLYVLEISER